MRPLLESLGLFLLPFAVFALYLAARLKYPLAVEHWTRGRVSWLALAGLVAALVGLIALNAFAPRGHGVYIPARIENGVIVPGRFE
jgi:Na+/H+-dicarboxylate symporter